MMNKKGVAQIGIGLILVVGFLIYLGMTGSSREASISPQSQLPVSQSSLECVHIATYVPTTNATVRTSTTDNGEVFVDFDESLGSVIETAGSVEISTNITCSRPTTDLSKGEGFLLVANSENYLSEID